MRIMEIKTKNSLHCDSQVISGQRAVFRVHHEGKIRRLLCWDIFLYS